MINPFVSFRGFNHIITPIGYGLIKKTILSHDAYVRSATEQYQIHSIACEFESTCLRAPKLHTLIDHESYIMHEVEYGDVLSRKDYKSDLRLLNELVRFYGYMIQAGYYPYSYTIIRHDSAYTILDFSQFGTVQRSKVLFKHIDMPVELYQMDRETGILSFMNGVF